MRRARRRRILIPRLRRQAARRRNASTAMITAMLAGPTPLAGAQGGDEIDSKLADKGRSTRTVDSNAFAGTLQLGSTGRAVVQLQQALGVPADGVFGARTEAAVREYQQ